MKAILNFLVLSLLMLVTSNQATAQINITRYFRPNLPIVVMDDYLPVNFQWNMSGELQALINEGINSLDENKTSTALLNLNRAVRIDSTLWMSRYYRGICYKRLGLVDSSNYDFLATINLNPTLAEPHIERAENYIERKQLRKASRDLDLAIEKNPSLPQIYYNQAALAIFESNINKARRLYKKANEVGPKYPDAYLMQGLLTAYKNDSKEAFELIGKAIEVDSTYSEAYFWRGFILLETNKTEECLKEWNSLIQYNPTNVLYLVMRGYLYIEQNQFDNAYLDFKNALKADEVDENRFAGKQSALDKRIDLQAAANYLIANGYGLDETAFAFLKKGFCLMLVEKTREALESLTHAENIQPSATVYFLKAMAFEHLGEHPKALEYYTRALKRDNDIFDAHKKRTVYRLELKDWDGAHQDLQDMFRLEPDSHIGHRLSGIVKGHQRDYAGALKHLDKFLAIDTTDFEIYRTRAVCYTMLQKRDEAHRDLLVLLKKEPLSWPLRDEISGYYLMLKDTAQALTVLKEYADLRPAIYLPKKKMAAIYVEQRDFAHAESLIAEVKKMIDEHYQPWEYSEIYMWEGVIASNRKDFKKAIDKFSLAVKRDRENRLARYHRAKTYQQTGQIKKSLEDFEYLAAVDFQDSKAIYASLKKQ